MSLESSLSNIEVSEIIAKYAKEGTLTPEKYNELINAIAKGEITLTWSKELEDALQAYKDGERNSKKKLRKFVGREISELYYNELIKKHSFSYELNRNKRDRKRKKKIKKVIWGIFSFAVLIISFLCTLRYMVLWYDKSGGFWYVILFIIALGFIGEINAEELSELRRENEQLKEQNKKLEKSYPTNNIVKGSSTWLPRKRKE